METHNPHNAHRPTYDDTEELTQVLQGLHMSQILDIDDNGANEEGPYDIHVDISRMNGAAKNDDYTIRGSPALQAHLHALIKEYNDIFSYSVGGTVDGRPTNGNVRG